VELTNANDQILTFSAPASWTQWEIRNANMSALIQDSSTHNITTWHIPPHATVSFTTNIPPLPLTIHHPVLPLLTLSIMHIDGDQSAAQKETYFLNNETVTIK